ncbi:MAG: electron transfer flavoprotein subunit beta/FixA family protein [Thermoplasmata archaeon]|jgi:electron transfer flavoprotein beta subunit
MDIVVLVKATPVLEEAKITEDGKNLDTSELKFFMNETDTYALEEAILKKEKYGGKVTVVTLADSEIENDVNDMIYESYAKGADDGVIIEYSGIYLDPYAKAKIISDFLKTIKFDLVLLGAQSTDTSYSLLGQLIARHLDLPYTTLVSSVELNGNMLKVVRELEEGLQAVYEIPLPSLLTIQSGINTPRYPPFVKIRNARSRPIKRVSIEDIIKDPQSLVKVKRTRLYIPPSKGAANILKGEPEELAAKLAEIIKGVVPR